MSAYNTTYKRLNPPPSTLVLIDVNKASTILGKSVRTIQRLCHNGRLNSSKSLENGKWVYRVHIDINSLPETTQSSLSGLPHKTLIGEWLRWVESSDAYAETTIRDYTYWLDRFFETQDCVCVESVRDGLANISKKQSASREKLHRSLSCFVKFMVEYGYVYGELADQLRTLKPKSNKAPNRLILSFDEVETLLGDTYGLADQNIVKFLIHSGLRVSEAVNLKWSDVNLSEGKINILGKGGKRRFIGVTSGLKDVLESLDRGHTPHVLATHSGNSFTTGGIRSKLERLGSALGFKITAHSLRRAFGRYYVIKKGVPISMVQRAYGHASLSMTEVYCQLREEEVISAMSGW
jgi:integrase/recombinase XerD